TIGPDGNLWFTDQNPSGLSAAIGRITPSGALTEFPLGAYFIGDSLTVGPDGNLWFPEGVLTPFGMSTDAIIRITPAGAITTVPFLPRGMGTFGLATLTVGPDGNFWFSEGSGVPGAAPRGSIGRVTLTGALTIFPLPGSGIPGSLTVGPDGGLWFPDSGP